MKRVVVNFGVAMVFGFALCALAGAQSDSTSLGDYARSVKKNKPQAPQASAKVYDNDNLPDSTAISVVGAPDTSKPAQNNVKDDPKNGKADASAAPKATPGQKDGVKDPLKEASKITSDQSANDRLKAYDAWKQRIDDQRKKVDQLAHDLSDLQGKTPAAIMPDDFKEKYKQDLAAKQKALDEAKTVLNQLQQEAHQSGVPSSVTD